MRVRDYQAAKFAIAFAALIFGSISSQAQSPERIVNRTLGLELVKPADWQFLTAEANAENLQRLHTDDPEFPAAIARYASVPLVAFTKYAEPYPDLNPSFKINARPYGPFADRSAKELITLILPSLSRAFPDLKVEQAPLETVIDGQPAAYVRLTYTLVAGQDRFPTTSELWIVPRQGYFLMIGAGTRQDEANGSREEIQSILSSFKFDP